jgi:Tfp pilus assembly protein PilF
VVDRPKLAIPHVFLARMARQDGDLPRAFNELKTAVTLEPASPVALREMGQYLLQANQPGQAVTWFTRALKEDASDRAAQGWMGCALVRQGQADIAARFFQRAGSGDWSACQQAAPQVMPPGAVAPPPAPRP